MLLGGSTIQDGSLKAYVTAVGDDTVLANILKMVKAAQGEKPPVQILADKISAVFVPLVLSIALATLVLNYFSHMVHSVKILVLEKACCAPSPFW